jgi:hypothetical protein
MPRIPTELGAGIERALGDVSVPAYVIDAEGTLIWLNPAAQSIEIAEMLHIARETVRNHVRSILRKHGVHSRLEAIMVARAEGVLAD